MVYGNAVILSGILKSGLEKQFRLAREIRFSVKDVVSNGYGDIHIAVPAQAIEGNPFSITLDSPKTIGVNRKNLRLILLHFESQAFILCRNYS